MFESRSGLKSKDKAATLVKTQQPHFLFLPELLSEGGEIFYDVPSKSSSQVHGEDNLKQQKSLLALDAGKVCWKRCRANPCQTNNGAAQLENPVLEEEKLQVLHREDPMSDG